MPNSGDFVLHEVRSGSGQTAGPIVASLDRLLADAAGNEGPALFSGAVLFIAHRGVVVHEAAYGLADALRLRDGEIRAVDVPRAMTVDTVFDLASITKVAATTVAMMKLADRGDLGLDRRLTEYMPAFDNATRAVTIRQLLTHRLAVAWQPTWLHLDEDSSPLTYLTRMPVDSVGERFQYSDQAFMILGALVAHTSGQSLDTFVRQEIYEPLGMANTGYRPDAATRQRCAATSHGNPYEMDMVRRLVRDGDLDHTEPFDDAAGSFAYRDYTLVGEVNDGNCHYAWRGVAGHAGLFATARDLGILAQALLNGGTYAGTRIVSEDVVTEFSRAPFDPNRAHGFERDHLEAMPGALGHSGFTGTRLAFWPAEQLIVVMLTNRQHRYLSRPVAYPDVTPIWHEVIARSAALADQP
jgi:serine-type D-Ala-D-Ala carboxypeptidase